VTLVTIDTTLLASGSIGAATPPGRLLAAWTEARYELVLSEALLDELIRTLGKPYFVDHVPAARVAYYLAALRSRAILTPLSRVVRGVAAHPEDDVVLSTALSGGAQFLVTTDYRFLSLRQYEGVLLITAHEFLAMLPGLEQ
jgi:uncharacterized protein